MPEPCPERGAEGEVKVVKATLPLGALVRHRAVIQSCVLGVSIGAELRGDRDRGHASARRGLQTSVPLRRHRRHGVVVLTRMSTLEVFDIKVSHTLLPAL